MGKSGRKSLKVALLSQQSRLKTKHKNAQAMEEREKRNSRIRSKDQGSCTATRTTVPFHPTDRILLIGEGNFSFARALVLHPPPGLESLPPTNVTATAYDTEVECCAKYADAERIIQTLRDKGVEVLFEVDATRLEKCAPLKSRRWNRIMWNFPHAGKGITDQNRNILSNQLLILAFLRSAAKFLALGRTPSVHGSRKRKQKSSDDGEGDSGREDEPPDNLELSESRGTILITLRNVPPYTLWDVPRLAKNPPAPSTPSTTKLTPPYTLLRSFAFHRWAWKGYEHRMTKGERAHGEGKPGEGGEDRTWEFCLRDELQV